MVRLARGGRRGAARVPQHVCGGMRGVSGGSAAGASGGTAVLIHSGVSPRYQHAVANPGLITFTGPYLDVGGAGYVVTISHTIHASR